MVLLWLVMDSYKPINFIRYRFKTVSCRSPSKRAHNSASRPELIQVRKTKQQNWGDSVEMTTCRHRMIYVALRQK